MILSDSYKLQRVERSQLTQFFIFFQANLLKKSFFFSLPSPPLSPPSCFLTTRPLKAWAWHSAWLRTCSARKRRMDTVTPSPSQINRNTVLWNTGMVCLQGSKIWRYSDNIEILGPQVMVQNFNKVGPKIDFFCVDIYGLKFQKDHKGTPGIGESCAIDR